MVFSIVTDDRKERLGSFAVIILDGRKSIANLELDAIDHCKREKANGYNIYSGESILNAQIIKHGELE